MLGGIVHANEVNHHSSAKGASAWWSIPLSRMIFIYKITRPKKGDRTIQSINTFMKLLVEEIQGTKKGPLSSFFSEDVVCYLIHLFLGVAAGLIVGFRVGLRVGTFLVGLIVGTRVGSFVGVNVVGLEVGKFVGCLVGSLVGVVVG